MCVWTKKRGSMNAVVLVATPCQIHGDCRDMRADSIGLSNSLSRRS